MVLFTTLKENFEETTKELTTFSKWVVRLVLLTITASTIALLIGVGMHGAPNIAFLG